MTLAPSASCFERLHALASLDHSPWARLCCSRRDGVFLQAQQDVPPGTVVHTSNAFVHSGVSLEDIVCKLVERHAITPHATLAGRHDPDISMLLHFSTGKRTAFHAAGQKSDLSQAFLDHLASVLMSNGFVLRSTLSGTAITNALFLSLASFFNHSCQPNCHFYFAPQKKIVIASIRAIRKGEELTISYQQGSERFCDHAPILKEALGADCLCAACSAPASRPLGAAGGCSLDEPLRVHEARLQAAKRLLGQGRFVQCVAASQHMLHAAAPALHAWCAAGCAQPAAQHAWVCRKPHLRTLCEQVILACFSYILAHCAAAAEQQQQLCGAARPCTPPARSAPPASLPADIAPLLGVCLRALHGREPRGEGGGEPRPDVVLKAAVAAALFRLAAQPGWVAACCAPGPGCDDVADESADPAGTDSGAAPPPPHLYFAAVVLALRRFFPCDLLLTSLCFDVDCHPALGAVLLPCLLPVCEHAQHMQDQDLLALVRGLGGSDMECLAYACAW